MGERTWPSKSPSQVRQKFLCLRGTAVELHSPLIMEYAISPAHHFYSTRVGRFIFIIIIMITPKVTP